MLLFLERVDYMRKNNFKELEIFTGIAILFVVIIHANAHYLNVFGIREYADMRLMFNTINVADFYDNAFALMFNTIDKIVHVAVPMFIFAAGFKFELNNKKEDYAYYLKKKCNQVFKPFLTVSVIVLFISRFGKLGIGNPLIALIKDIIRLLVGYNLAYQLWYVPMYLFVVLSYPLILKIIKNDTLRTAFFVALAVIWTVIDVYLPIVKSLPHPLSFIYYFIFYELGAMYCRNQINRNGYMIFIYLGLVILSLFVPLRINVVYTEMLFTPIAVMSLFEISRKIQSSLLVYLNKHSFYIFLFHEPFFISGLIRLCNEIGISNYFIVIPFVAILSIVLCIVLMKMVGFIPIMNTLLNIKQVENEDKLINKSIG